MNATRKPDSGRPLAAGRFLALFLLSLGLVASARAQQTAPSDIAPTDFTQEEVSGYDLSSFGPTWWNGVGRAVDLELKGTDSEVERALQKVIFLATYYPEQANFRRSNYEIYLVWRFNRDERLRLMAISAMTAIGDDGAMRLLAYRDDGFSYAPWEESPLVRRLTAAAVGRHFGTPEVEVGPLTPATTSRPS